ncbi:DJ-1/PfpI family protein [Bacillus sonorensis]|uniref:Intracellular protease n=2 Tax=Bacillus sonorensis TaxID=119858 RepID=M5P0B9_9BACI|nr:MULTISPECIES: DJ-1 family glyoxalase III [Bacillus]TWK77106.1 putative cysteine protease YraA [Bacillus paralicheniformis]ASB87592.1 Protein DJ-1 like protein B [Bacillus sonorensis]EME72894.1 intracellular protease [Bacillus sonorensis L12]MBG9916369.1 thiamine biosynthesis protein ThiJ [Bacillus sonorensis]MCF7617043.1 DJ-1/PfpI family protein [Bacillus sonorensis]
MKKAFVFLIDGFEEIEAIATIDILRRAEVDTVTISLDPALRVKGGHGIVIEADQMYEDTDFQEADMLILPGGNVGSKKMLEHAGLHETLKEAAAAGTYIAAICAATMTLGKAGLVNGKKATCYPGVEKELTGADIITDENVVTDGRIITSRGPATTIPFALQLAELLNGKEKADEVAKGMLVY